MRDEPSRSVELDLADLQRAPEAAAAIISAPDVMVHNLMLPDNGVMKRLQDAVTAVEYTYPTSFQVLSAWMVGLNKPSLSAAIGSLRNVAHHHVWKLEEHLLGPHH